MLTKTIEGPLILPAIRHIAKWEPRQYHRPAAGVSRVAFQHSSSNQYKLFLSQNKTYSQIERNKCAGLENI